jgi:uncharacterized protein YyaL (SSP411 family)
MAYPLRSEQILPMSLPQTAENALNLPTPEAIAALPSDGGTEFNRLIFAQSPYLLQHARNPVDWWEWSEAAFAEARRRDVPVLLSIGYSTCHWCHVMKRESFENPVIARQLNDAFVCIKLDREERPDIDQVYMQVTMAMTGHGGWPMTVLMTADKEPFFAGTYFPPEGRLGRPGVTDLVRAIKQAWAGDRGQLLQSASHTAQALAGMSDPRQATELPREIANRAMHQYQSAYDARHGGFGGGRNKFPVPHNFLFLLTHHLRTGSTQALQMVEHTLQSMRRGGIFDQFGFGFHRYSTDQEWLLPHFEKMLYDQALMVWACVEAARVTGDEEYARIARETIEYVLRELRAPEGAFYSAEDAESEHEEGKFYIWTPQEVAEALGEDEATLFCDAFNILPGGNFRDEATGAQMKESIPHLRKPLHEIAAQHNMAEPDLRARLDAHRRQLFSAREKRVHPFKDDKILTDWNGLMIGALALAGSALNESALVDAARTAADWVLANLRDANGRLLKRARLGKAGLPALLEDHVFLAFGLIELYEATFDARYLQEAITIARQTVEYFADERDGTLFQTARDAEKLPARAKDIYDGAQPSGNGMAAYLFARLGLITGDRAWSDRAARILAAFGDEIARAPMAHAMSLLAHDVLTGPATEIVLSGDASDPAFAALATIARQRRPPATVILLNPCTPDPPIATISNYAALQPPIDGKPTAYICRDFACELPVTDAEAFGKRLDSLGAPRGLIQ